MTKVLEVSATSVLAEALIQTLWKVKSKRLAINDIRPQFRQLFQHMVDDFPPENRPSEGDVKVLLGFVESRFREYYAAHPATTDRRLN